MIEGVLRHCTNMEIEKNYVDSHGQSEVAFAFCHLLGFELLPTGLVGVFFGAILAIHLSTISSHLNLGALYFTRDLYQRYLKPDASEKQLVWIGRASTLVLLIGSFFYGLMMEEIVGYNLPVTLTWKKFM